MRVFVAGATGVIGRPLVAALVGRGHEVTGLTRSAERAERLAAQHATPVVADVFDRPRLVQAVADARPDVVVHQLTALPKRIDPRRIARDTAATNRIRTEGTDNLVAAAQAAGARRFVAQSIAFAYAADGDEPRAEDGPLVEPVGIAAPLVRAVAHLERATTGAEGLEGVVLRYGFFYGPGTVYAAGGSMHADVKKRRVPLLGRARGRFSFVHVDDAAGATVRAIEGRATGVFNVVEDAAPAVHEWIPAYAAAIDAPRPLRVPGWLGRLVAGAYAAYMMDTLPAAANAKAKGVLGWTPTRRWSDPPVLDGA